VVPVLAILRLDAALVELPGDTSKDRMVVMTRTSPHVFSNRGAGALGPVWWLWRTIELRSF